MREWEIGRGETIAEVASRGGEGELGLEKVRKEGNEKSPIAISIKIKFTIKPIIHDFLVSNFRNQNRKPLNSNFDLDII